MLEEKRNEILSGKDAILALRMSIPSRYIGKTFKGLHDKGKYLQGKEKVLSGSSLFLSGRQGRGKTHLAVILMLDWVVDHLRVSECGRRLIYPCLPRFLSIGDLNVNFDQAKKVTSEINTHLLVIDDVCTRTMSEWSKEILRVLVDRQYRNNRQVIATSNVSLKQLYDNVDASIASRLVEMGREIAFGGRDWRLEQE